LTTDSAEKVFLARVPLRGTHGLRGFEGAAKPVPKNAIRR
jgi:hypothetical protein